MTMMRTRTRWTAAAATLALLPLLGACGTDDEDPGVTTTDTAPTSEQDDTQETTTPADDATETTEEPTLSDAEQDEDDAQAALDEYLRVLDEVRRGNADIEALNEVSVGVARDQWITEMTAYRERGWTSMGETVRELESADVEEDEAVFEVCSDVTEVDVVDEDGESVVSPDRPDVTLNMYVLERNDEAQNGWIVADDTNQGESCDG